jgi:hypothetical protein
MSEISVLSNQYEKLVSTSDKVNNSVITLKKRGILSRKENKLYPKLKVDPSEIDSASALLVSFLQNVVELLKNHSQDSQYIPSMIVNDYVSRLSTQNQFISEDIEELLKKLNKNDELEEKNIQVLDALLAVLDIERSNLFRKLRTARG